LLPYILPVRWYWDSHDVVIAAVFYAISGHGITVAAAPRL
jgi:hypothetical protein